LRCIVVCDSFTDTSEQYDCQCETSSAADTVEDGFDEGITLLHVQYGNTQYCTVCCDQGQEYAQCLIQSRSCFFQEHFYKLYQGCDNQNERDVIQVFDVQRNQDQVINQPRSCTGQYDNEDYGHTHAGCGV